MQPDAVQRRNKPFECRVILLGALNSASIGMDEAATRTVIQDKQGLKNEFFRLVFLRCYDHAGFKERNNYYSVIEQTLTIGKKPRKTIFYLNLM